MAVRLLNRKVDKMRVLLKDTDFAAFDQIIAKMQTVRCRTGRSAYCPIAEIVPFGYNGGVRRKRRRNSRKWPRCARMQLTEWK